MRSIKYTRVAKAIIVELTEEMIKLLTRNALPDFYYNLETKITNSMESAYQEGLKDGREEILREVIKFDESKDKLEN